MKSNLYLIILISMLFVFIRCEKYCHKEVQFRLPVTIYPQKEKFGIGDTIWIEMQLPYTLRDEISGDDIDAGTYPFKASMNILEILDTTWIDGLHGFDIVKSIGKLDTNGISFPRIDPEFSDINFENSQKWKFGIIPRKKALSTLLIFSKVNYTGDWSGVKHFPNDGCDYAINKSYYQTNNGTIDYEGYVKQFPQTHNPGSGPDTITNLKNAGAFFFSVE